MNEESGPLNSEITLPKWPELGDKLFVQGQGKHVAFLGLRTSFSVYAIGYKDAADTLVERILEKDFGADLQFYPIAFLYRHYMELQLKQLLICGGHLVHNESRLKHDHDLTRLWPEVRKILEDVWPDSHIDELDAVGKCINELCSLDAESMSFRYPFTKTGQPTLPTLNRVDLINLKNVMARIGSFLDCSGDALENILQNMPSASDYY